MYFIAIVCKIKDTDFYKKGKKCRLQFAVSRVETQGCGRRWPGQSDIKLEQIEGPPGGARGPQNAGGKMRETKRQKMESNEFFGDIFLVVVSF